MRPQQRIWLENGICAALLLVMPILAVCPNWWTNQTPVSAHNLLFAPPWEEAFTPGMEPDLDVHANETALKYYPWFRFLNQSAHSGQSILWNPLEALGTPFMAQWRTRVFSPFSIPFYFLPLDWAFQASILMKLIVAGWCAYYATRRFGLTPPMALFVGVVAQFSGPVFLWPLHPMADVVPWFPLLLPSAERLLMGRVRAWPLAAMTIALMALGGDPETLGVAVFFVALYLFARRIRTKEWTHFGWDFLGLLIAVALGLVLTAVQLFPYVEYLVHAAPAADTPRATLQLTDLAAVFLPQFINPDRADAVSIIRLLHVGVLPILLLALWCSLRSFVSKDLRRGVEAMFLTAGIFILIPLALGGLLSRIPLLSQLQPQHFLIAHGFAFAFLAAAAAEEWNALNPEECKAALMRLFLFIPLLWGLLFGGIAFGVWKLGPPTSQFWIGFALAGAVAFVLMILLGVTLLQPSVHLMGYALSLLTALSLWWMFHSALPTASPNEVFPNTAFIQSLKSMQTRIAGSTRLKEWPMAGNDIPQVYNPSGTVLQRYASFMSRMELDPLLIRRTGAQGLLLTKNDIQGAFAKVRPFLHIQEVFPSGAVLFKDLEARPRAQMIYAGRRVDAFQPDLLGAGLPPLLEGVMLPEKDDGPEAAAQVISPENNNRITVKIEQTRPGVLVLADMWYPGWYATVDGKRAEVFPVDGVFRGVEIGEGAHEVVFRFDPRWYRLGSYVSLATLIVVLLGLRQVAQANPGPVRPR